MEESEAIIKITTGVINHQIDNVTARLKGELKDFWVKHIASFKQYISAANSRYEKTKTLLYKDLPVSILDMYVGTRLKIGAVEISEDEFIEQLLLGNRCLVNATAGAGKSFFSKWVFLKLLSGKQIIPLYIELRNLNDTERGVIDHLVYDLKSNFDIALSRDQMIELIANGRFALILDGYDELTNVKTKQINAELLSLEAAFNDSAVLVTSRPGMQDIGYLSGFSVFQILPFTIDQAVSLVQKLQYDEAVKKSFLDNLKNKLFEKHTDFLSNPLLLNIMLMTYGDLAEIPSKMHIFYEQAFDTLFYRHDSSKGMYRRESQSGLAIDDFRDILACVSASSYIRGKISLSNTDLLTFIRKAKQTANISKLKPVDFVEDLVRSVCVLLQDGTKYTYNHRSFQEYFAAFFLVQIPTERKLDVYRRYLDKEETDSALVLAFEMNQGIVERDFIMPLLRELLEGCPNPEQLMMKQMRGLSLVRKKIRYRSEKRIKTRLDDPRYLIEESTSYWNFQRFLERVYQKDSKKFLKFVTFPLN